MSSLFHHDELEDPTKEDVIVSLVIVLPILVAVVGLVAGTIWWFYETPIRNLLGL